MRIVEGNMTFLCLCLPLSLSLKACALGVMNFCESTLVTSKLPCGKTSWRGPFTEERLIDNSKHQMPDMEACWPLDFILCL